MRLATRAVHSGEPDTVAGAHPVSAPIHTSATFYYDHTAELDAVAGGAQGYMYGRYRNPTNVALEAAVAALEGAEPRSAELGPAPAIGALSFASGMAALHAAILASGVTAKDVIVCAQEIYGGTIGLLMNAFAPLGMEIRFADFNNPQAVDTALSGPGVRLVIVESLSNPLLRVVDLAALAEKTHAAGAKLLVDATFTSPVLLQALALGADYSVHSATKYMSGHGDAMGGMVAAGAGELATLDGIRKLVGGILGPFAAWTILRGLKTLPLRMERQCANAARIAEFLRAHPAIERVNYPGFADHPDHATAARQFSGHFGAMVSFEVKGADRAAILRLMDRFQLCLPCTSLGDVQTLVLYPVLSSHRDMAPRQRERVGIRDNLLRLSVGIEDPADITEDLDQALHS